MKACKILIVKTKFLLIFWFYWDQSDNLFIENVLLTFFQESNFYNLIFFELNTILFIGNLIYFTISLSKFLFS